MSGISFVISSPSTLSPLSSNSATSDLFDQSALSTLAQRLVEAAKRAGADAADAVAGLGGKAPGGGLNE
jgi:PmbA protein